MELPTMGIPPRSIKNLSQELLSNAANAFWLNKGLMPDATTPSFNNKKTQHAFSSLLC